MNRLNVLLVAALCCLSLSAGAQSSGKSGVFTTDFNDLVFSWDGNKVTGTYEFRNGRIEGTLKGHTLTGRWIQDNAKGRLIFEFNEDFTAFTGKWSYNDETPTSSKWDGKLKPGTGTGLKPGTGRGISIPTGDFSTDFNALRFHQDGNKVTGTYDHRNGRIEGTLNGRTLTGRWTQDNGKGRFVFEFNEGFTAFEGKWSYDDNEPTGTWNGKLIGAQEASRPSGSDQGARKAAPAAASLPTRDFSSSFNDLRFRQDGDKVTGTYDFRNGRIEGTLSGHTLTGRWIQENAKGRLVFEFNDDFTAFTGKWSYDDAEPTGTWDGKLK